MPIIHKISSLDSNQRIYTLCPVWGLGNVILTFKLFFFSLVVCCVVTYMLWSFSSLMPTWNLMQIAGALFSSTRWSVLRPLVAFLFILSLFVHHKENRSLWFRSLSMNPGLKPEGAKLGQLQNSPHLPPAQLSVATFADWYVLSYFCLSVSSRRLDSTLVTSFGPEAEIFSRHSFKFKSSLLTFHHFFLLDNQENNKSSLELKYLPSHKV